MGSMIPLDGGSQAGFEAHPNLFRLMYAACVLYTIVQAPIIVALAIVAIESGPVRALTSVAVTLVYIPLNAGNYFLN